MAAAHATPSPASALSLWLGWGPKRPKCPKTRRALGAYPVAGRRASLEGRGRPALALPQPNGKGPPGAELGNLNRSLSSPLPRNQDPASGPGCSHNGWRVHPGSGFSQHLCEYTRHGSALTHPKGARVQHCQLQTARPGRSAADGVCELAPCALRSAARLGAGCVVAGSPGAQDARHALCSPGGV